MGKRAIFQHMIRAVYRFSVLWEGFMRRVFQKEGRGRAGTGRPLPLVCLGLGLVGTEDLDRGEARHAVLPLLEASVKEDARFMVAEGRRKYENGVSYVKWSRTSDGWHEMR